MSVISVTEYPQFEKWVIEIHADMFAEWELEASHLLDFDEWVNTEYPEIITAWRNPSRVVSEECVNCSYEYPSVCRNCPFGQWSFGDGNIARGVVSTQGAMS